MLIGWLGAFEPWVKALHLIFMVFWMAGLFMLPRFLVYHQEAAQGSDEDRLWAERERRLISIIMDPSMVLVWAFGLALAFNLGAFAMWWFRLKLLCVIGLSVYHMWMGGYAKRLALGERRLSGRTLRLLNEVPGVAAIVVIVLVVVKPWL
jgi:putative membrane protein